MKNSFFMLLGYVAGSGHDQKGGPAEYICLTNNPQWGRYVGSADNWPSYIYGAEYEIHSAYNNRDLLLRHNNNGQSLDEQDVPCVYCKVKGRSVVTTFAAATRCPAGWDLEYQGYLMAEYHNHPRQGGPICVDEAPETLVRGGANLNGALLYFVRGKCGSLPCPPYVNDRQLACVVCSL